MTTLQPLNFYRFPTDPRPKVFGKADTNAGLAYFKFFGAKPNAAGGASESTGALLAAFMNLPTAKRGTRIAMTVGDAKLITEHGERLAALADCSFELKQVSRLMTGLGLPHATDNGFAFHHLLSVPPLAGTALKTIAKNAAKAAGAKDADIDINRIFGTANDGRGSVAFLDALPFGPVTLTLEQITNHYPGYYQGPNPAKLLPRTDMQQPADWYNPIPVSLLAVEASFAKPQSWQFGLKKLRGAKEDDLCRAQQWLTAGLASEGFGAKVDDGFGRFMTEEVLKARPVPDYSKWFPKPMGIPQMAAGNVQRHQVGAIVELDERDGKFTIIATPPDGMWTFKNTRTGLEVQADKDDIA